MKEVKGMSNAFKYGKHYFIAYDKERETKVISDIFKYTSNFLILETNYIDIFSSRNSLYYHYDNIKLNSLFSSYSVINTNYAEKNKVNPKNHKNINHIYFYMIPDIKNIIERNDYYVNIGRVMVESISDYCVFDGEIIVNNRLFFKFSNKMFKNINISKRNKFLFALGGIGDFFIEFSIIYECLNNINYKDIYIIDYSIRKSEIFDYMVNLCYGSKVKLLDYHYCNEYFLRYWLLNCDGSVLYKSINKMFNLYKHEAEHMAHLYKKTLIGERKLDYYKHNEILKKQILKSVSDQEKNYIEGLIRSKKNNIGLQYFTKFTFGGRKWDERNVKAFIKKCKENNINLIVLNSETYSSSLQEFCTKKLSIAGYALLISKMDLVVGVDSSAGHIASFYNIPSITLWGQGSPLALDYYNSNIGFRALRKNYSILAKNKEVSSISFNTVFSLVQKFTKNELSFKDEIITYRDSVNGYNMLYV